MYVYRENTAKRQNILTIKQKGQCIQEWTRENLWKAAFTWSILLNTLSQILNFQCLKNNFYLVLFYLTNVTINQKL